MIHPAQVELYVNAGYTVIAADYRLAPETKLPEILRDVQDAIAWVRSEGSRLFNVDPTRLAIIGHSAGGYLTLLAGRYVHPRPQALVAFYGYGDIVGPWYSTPSAFYCQQPLVSEVEAAAVIGTTEISEPPLRIAPTSIPLGIGAASISIVVNRGAGPRPRPVSIHARTTTRSCRSARFSMSPRIIHRRCCSMETRIQMCRTNNP